MIVEHSGWKKDKGCFTDRYILNETGLIIVEDNTEYKQLTPFQLIEKDWNNDGDVYELYVASFESKYGTDYYTPENLVSLVVNEEAEVIGLKKI